MLFFSFFMVYKIMVPYSEWHVKSNELQYYYLHFQNKELMLPSSSSYCLLQDRPLNRETSCWGKEEWLFQKASRRRRWTSVPKNPLTWVRIQASFILKGEGRGWLLQTSWCRWNPLFLHPPTQVRSWCSCKPPTRQMLFSVLQLFISIWMEKCYAFKGQSLENGFPIYFRL